MLSLQLEKGLSGKTWDGKEVVLRAAVHLLKYSPVLQDVKTNVVKVFIRESKRTNLAYRKHALECLGDFAELQGVGDLYSSVAQVVTDVAKQDNADDMDVDPKSGEQSSKGLAETIVTSAIIAQFQDGQL